MIYTITLNPSLDYVVGLKTLRVGEVNRAKYEAIYPGGKGINVSVMLARLGLPTVALGVTAGFTGEQITRLLGGCGCPHDFVTALQGISRLSVKILSGSETEINGSGPVITQEELNAVLQRLSDVGQGDVVVLSGSVPQTAPADAYTQLLTHCAARGASLAVDTTGERLLASLCHRPLLIKPNRAELEELFGCEIATAEQIVAHARLLQARGARHVLVSLGGDGAVLIAEDGAVYQANPPKGTVQCTVGAGDSMVAGFLASLVRGGEVQGAFALAVAAGSATAYSPWLAAQQDVLGLEHKITVNKLTI